MLRKPHPLQSFWIGCKWLTVFGSVVAGILIMIFGFANTDLPGWGWFCAFGSFYIWCGHSLKNSLVIEEAKRTQFTGDDDESSYY